VPRVWWRALPALAGAAALGGPALLPHLAAHVVHAQVPPPQYAQRVVALVGLVGRGTQHASCQVARGAGAVRRCCAAVCPWLGPPPLRFSASQVLQGCAGVAMCPLDCPNLVGGCI
jgi:hypothetical protein